MMRERQYALLSVCACLALAALISACSASAGRDVPELERRASALNKTIMCPVCPGESIDQSQNPLAVQMRAISYQQLEDGASEREIRDFFVERYGPSVLMEPPTEGVGLAAWLVPPLAFALAVAALLLTLRWMRMSGPPSGGPSDASGDADRSGYVRRMREVVSSAGSAEGDDSAREVPSGRDESRSA